MKHNKSFSLRYVTTSLLLMACTMAFGQSSLRRPISPSQPAWIIHIDVWNEADPQKIIDMVPEDIRPYVIFNISTSSSDNKSPDGPAIYDSWMKVCAQNRVWTMIQCSSGAHNRMPDTPNDVSAYEKYFKEYPNFLGFNFAEQFWDFGVEPWPTFPQRLQLFAKLLLLCRQYGGYLAASFTDSYYNASKMPMAWMKRNNDIKSFLTAYPEHFLCFEKYTQKKCFLDMESNCLGQWLAGYAGQYGIRFDKSGWVAADETPDSEGNTKYTIGTSDYVRAAGAIPVAEHIMLTGQTMMDGPELIWTECSREVSISTADGFTQRNWEWFPQFRNISLDLFRKILDGTIRIPSREEVINRTKVCLVNDKTVVNVNNEYETDPYITPGNLFDGLYRHTCDQGGRDTENRWLENHWWMKSTGRYPTIPQVYSAPAGMTSFNVSSFDKTTFDSWMQTNFPEEYTGNIYAGHHENGWVTYNPFQYDDVTDGNGVRTLGTATQRATGTIPFQYNTCTSVDLDYAPYSLGIMKEYADHVDFYLSNYQTDGTVSQDIIKVNGSASEPQVNWTDRGSHDASNVVTSWCDGVLTITVDHNGPLDLTVTCSSNATGRKTSYTSATLSAPQKPEVYAGVLQYEAENADYKSATCQKNGYGQEHDGYQGLGYAVMSSSSSALRYHVHVPEAGYYLLTMRYQADAAGTMTAVSGQQTRTLTTVQATEWTESHIPIVLQQGEQLITLMNTGGKNTLVDCIRLEKQKIVPFYYSSLTGEYHVNLNDLTASGDVSFNPSTGEVSVPAKMTGSLTLLLDAADFTEVTSMTLSKTGGDAFDHLTITDVNGNNIKGVNEGTDSHFWSSKYNVNYSSYQTADASRQVYMLTWTANSNEADRSMSISDIVIKVGTGSSTIDESNGTPVVIPSSVTTKEIIYSRQLTAPSGTGDTTIDGQAAMLYTVCLPYQPPMGAGLKYYTLKRVSSGTLVFAEVNTVSANTPYLVAVTNGSMDVGTNNTAMTMDFDTEISHGTVSDGYQLKGTLRGLSNADAAEEGAYILQTGNVWGRVEAGTISAYIPPFRAYIVGYTSALTRYIGGFDDDGTTGIDRIRTIDMDGTEEWYDLQGHRLSTPQKGLNIVKGRDGKVRKVIK